MKVDPPFEVFAIALFAAASEVDDGADREARAIGRPTCIVDTDVVELRAQCQMRQDA